VEFYPAGFYSDAILVEEFRTAGFLLRDFVRTPILVNTLDDWGLKKSNVVAVVTDSGANIKKAIIDQYTANKLCLVLLTQSFSS